MGITGCKKCIIHINLAIYFDINIMLLIGCNCLFVVEIPLPIMKITEKFGRRIKEIRIEKGLSQEELSFRADIHRTYISTLELGKRNVSLVNIEKLAKALDCQICELFK